MAQQGLHPLLARVSDLSGADCRIFSSSCTDDHPVWADRTATPCRTFFHRMLALLASPFGLVPTAGRPHELCAHARAPPRSAALFLSQRNKPSKYADRLPQQLQASSHSKVQSNWRNGGEPETFASGAVVPVLPTNQLPQREGERIPNGRYPALVLNADYTPLSYVPLSLWSWQDTVRAVFREAVTVLSEYPVTVSSPSVEMFLPSVIVLKRYVGRVGRGEPCFTRRNLFLRDKFTCQYCEACLPMNALTYDHVRPRARGGATEWSNIVTACHKCNLRKAARPLEHIPDMSLKAPPHTPSWPELQHKARAFPPQHIHEDWIDYINPNGETAVYSDFYRA